MPIRMWSGILSGSRSFSVALALFVTVTGGCGRESGRPSKGTQRDTPVEIESERRSKLFGSIKGELTDETLAKLKPELAAAHARATASTQLYFLALVLDRQGALPETGQGKKFARFLILFKTEHDLDDLSFAISGKEAEENQGIETVHGHTFWIDKDGNVFEAEEAKGGYIVQEFYVEDHVPEVSLHSGGPPSLIKIVLR